LTLNERTDMRDFDADERTADIIQAININGARPLPVPAGDPPWTARDELAKAAMAAMLANPEWLKASCSDELLSEEHYLSRAVNDAMIAADNFLAARKENL
jgi:hypothetical protein